MPGVQIQGKVEESKGRVGVRASHLKQVFGCFLKEGAGVQALIGRKSWS